METRANSSNPQDLKKLASLMDSHFRLPGGIRVGWDGILGFIPGVGDALSNLVSFYILVRAAGIGVPPSVIIRMGLNVLVDNLIDMIPLLGNFFDIFWKANNRNLALIERYMNQPTQTQRSSRFVIALTLVMVLFVLIGSAVLVAVAAIWAFNQLQMGTWST